MGHDQAIALTALLPFLLPLLGLMFILFIFVSASARERLRACAELARELGLGFRRVGWLGAGLMSGLRAGQMVRVETWIESDPEANQPVTYARPAVSTQLLQALSFQIIRRSEWDQANGIRRESDIETGDDDFDRLFSVCGDDPAAVLALLTAPVRELLKAFDAQYGLLILDDLWLRSDTIKAFDAHQGLSQTLAAQEELIGVLSRAQSVALTSDVVTWGAAQRVKTKVEVDEVVYAR